MKTIQKMNIIVKNWYHSFKNTLIVAIILSFYTKVVNSAHHSSHHQGCGQEELVKCAQPLQVLTDSTEFTFVASKHELDILCPDLNNGLLCINSYTRRCMTMQQRDHFHKLYRGTSAVIKELCEEGPYQEEFLRHAPCMRGIVAEYEICTRRYQATMEAISNPPPRNNTSEEMQEADTIKSVCCSFQEYMECSHHTMKRACGEDTARFTKAFLDRMSSSLIKIHCSEYADDLYNKCGILSSASSQFSSVTSLLSSVILAALSVTARGVLFR